MRQLLQSQNRPTHSWVSHLSPHPLNVCVDPPSMGWTFREYSSITSRQARRLPQETCTLSKVSRRTSRGSPSSLVEKLCCTELKDIEDVKRQFPKVFSGLGTFGEDYEIELKEDASPFALHAPRSIPIALRAGAKEELNRMEKLGVVRKITEPTEWCAGMVVAPKKTGAMRICVDLKPKGKYTPYPLLMKSWPSCRGPNYLASSMPIRVSGRFPSLKTPNPSPHS